MAALKKLDPEELIQKAAELFRERGYAGTNMQEIAVSFGVTRPALHYHFRNKKDFLTAIHDRVMKRMLVRLEEITEMDADAPTKLREVIRHHVRCFAEESDLMAVFLQEESELTREDLERVIAEKREYSDKVEAIYRQGIEEGTLRADLDARIATYGMLGMCNWLYRWFNPQGSLSADAVADQLASLVTTGYLKSLKKTAPDLGFQPGS